MADKTPMEQLIDKIDFVQSVVDITQQKINDLKNIFPYLSIKSSLIKYLKTLRYV
jgi:hypothetical protein